MMATMAAMAARRAPGEARPAVAREAKIPAVRHWEPQVPERPAATRGLSDRWAAQTRVFRARAGLETGLPGLPPQQRQPAPVCPERAR